jgi:hypothetical protein
MFTKRPMQLEAAEPSGAREGLKRVGRSRIPIKDAAHNLDRFPPSVTP